MSEDETNNETKKILVFANCHGEKYINIFKRDTDIDKNFDIEFIVSYENLDNFDKIKRKFQETDILIINNIKNYENYKIENLKKILKKNVMIIIIPYIRFNGYWIPEKFRKLQNIDDNSVSFFPYIGKNNIDEYLNHRFDVNEFKNYCIMCLKKLKEIEDESDIKFFEFFLKNHLDYPMFRDNHHPTMNILEHVAKEILSLISKRYDIKYSKKTPELKKDILEYGHYKPIMNFVKEVLNIKYDLDKVFICSRKDFLWKIINYEENAKIKLKDLDDMREKLWPTS